MAKVRVPVIGTVGKAIRINPDATEGAQIGTDLQLPNGLIPDLAELARALYVASPPDGTLVIRIEQDSSGGPSGPVFESEIVIGTILARVADNETITGSWKFKDKLTIIDSTGVDSFEINHDGVDVNFIGITTTDLNITGVTKIQADTVNAEFKALTAVSFAGILGPNLTNSAAAQVVTGFWNFNEHIDFFSGLSIWNSGQTDRVRISHDGTDLNWVGTQTADWNISGITALNAGSMNADFAALTAATFGGVINLIEQAAAGSDVAGQGQVWVKNANPNELWFTAGNGSESQVGSVNPVGTAVHKVKTADESKATDTTLADDDALFGFSLTADKYYKFEAFIPYTQNVGNIKLKMQLSQAEQTAEWQAWVTDTSGNQESDHLSNMTGAIILTAMVDTADASIRITGTLKANATTGGILDFQWAQQLSEAGATVVKEGAWMTVTKLD